MRTIKRLGSIASAFIIAFFVLFSVTLMVKSDEGGFGFDAEKLTFTVFGEQYSLDKRVTVCAEKIFDFNEIYIGKVGMDLLKNVFSYSKKLICDTFVLFSLLVRKAVVLCT